MVLFGNFIFLSAEVDEELSYSPYVFFYWGNASLVVPSINDVEELQMVD